MTYVLTALILFVIICLLTFLQRSRFYSAKTCFRAVFTADALLSVSGAVVTAVSHIVISSRIADVTDSESFVSWASDMLGGWYSIAVPAVCVLLGINAAAALFAVIEKDGRSVTPPLLRSAVLAASSAVPLILAPFYGFMTENSAVPLYTAILASGIGLALVFRAVSLIDHIRELVKRRGK